MNSKCVAFACGALAPFRLGARLPQVQPARRGVRHAQISMSSTKKAGKGKKVAPIVFATDMKGKPVWKLRSARLEDVETATAIIGSLPRSLVQSFIEDSEMCSLVCEGTVQGTKEGEGYKSRIFGVVLVDISARIRDPEAGVKGGFVKTGEIIVAKVDPAMPDAGTVKQKLILGAMKRLKKADCGIVSITTKKDASTYHDELKGHGFNVSARDADTTELVANLMALNPDPQRKIE